MSLREIVKNIVKKELYLLVFIAIMEIIRILMKAGDNVAITLSQSIIMAIITAILAVIQQLIKKKA